MDYRLTLLQVVVLVILWLLEKLIHRIFQRYWRGRHPHLWWLWTILLWIFIGQNFASLYWLAYPIAVWMVWAIGLVIMQAVHNHEFIYRRYWPIFWRLSAWYAILVFIISTFCHHLPQI